MKPKLISRENLECHVAATDPLRFQLRAIRFEEDGTVSTDGHMLLKVPYNSQRDLSEFPNVESKDGDDGVETALVSLDAIAKLVRALPKGSIRPVLDNALLHGVGEHEATFTTTDLETTQDIRCKLVEGKYPPWEKGVAKEGKGTFSLILGVGKLEKLLKALKKSNASTIEFRVDPDAVKTGQYTTGVNFKVKHGKETSISAPVDRGIRGTIMPVITK